jgi:hypothetical protein
MHPTDPSCAERNRPANRDVVEELDVNMTDPFCAQPHPTAGYPCTRHQDHHGSHMVAARGKLLAAWDDDTIVDIDERGSIVRAARHG